MVVATAFVAVTAFVLAYDGSRGAAVDAGIRSAGWYPFCIEGVIVCASVATISLPGRRYPWVILLGFSAVSVAANVLHAWQHPGAHWWSMLFAAVPPLTLPICVHLVLMVSRAHEPGVVRVDRATLGEEIAAAVAEAVSTALPAPYMPEIPPRPEGSEAVIYRLYSDPGDLLYVGCTIDPWTRLRAHGRRQPWWDEVTAAEVLWLPSMELAADVEQQAIWTEHPIYNIAMGRYGNHLAVPAVTVPTPESKAESVVEPRAVTPVPRPERDQESLLECSCGLPKCARWVSKATRTRHRAKLQETAELAQRAQSNGHPVGVR